jgi:hypothetical protein
MYANMLFDKPFFNINSAFHFILTEILHYYLNLQLMDELEAEKS